MENLIEYFRPMYELFFVEFPYLIPIILGGSMLLEALVFLIIAIVKAIKYGDFSYDYEKFFIISTLTLLGYVLLYSIACFVFAFGARTQELNWRFWTLYMGFIDTHFWIAIIFFVLNGIIAIGVAIYFWNEHDSLLMAVLGLALGAIGGAAACGLLFLVIFLLYVIVAFLIYVVICLGMGFACMGVSIYKFFEINWLVATIITVLPGLMVGLVVALKNYLYNFKENLADSIHGSR